MQTCTYVVRSTSFFLRSQHKKVCAQHDNSERGIASRGELERLLQKIIVAPARNRFFVLSVLLSFGPPPPLSVCGFIFNISSPLSPYR